MNTYNSSNKKIGEPVTGKKPYKAPSFRFEPVFEVAQGLHVILANVLMVHNVRDYLGVKTLAAELGAQFLMDPTITPMMDGDRSILTLNVDQAALREVFRNEELAGNVEEFCAPPQSFDEEDLDMLPCSAGHTACYVSPYGDIYPCVQFPLLSGNVRRTKFVDVWRDFPQLREVRSITLGDMPTCSHCTHGKTCTRCPGLAFLEGNMRGPSHQDCEKSYARTGITSENLQSKKARRQSLASGPLVQIQCWQPAPSTMPAHAPEGNAVDAGLQ